MSKGCVGTGGWAERWKLTVVDRKRNVKRTRREVHLVLHHALTRLKLSTDRRALVLIRSSRKLARKLRLERFLRLDHPVVQGGSRREKWNGELQNRTAAAYSSERASFHDEYVAGDAVTVARDKSRTVGKGGW